MNRIIRLGLVALTFPVSLLCKAQSDQSIPKPVPASPNTASLGKYGDYPVSYYTGIPEISIPLFEVKSGELTVPITLSYHASGFKPTDVSSWVGAGWSLSAGGQVSVSVRGKADLEHYFSHPINTDLASCSSYYYLQYAARQVIDTEPDIYGYSFSGNSGKFLFPNGGTYTGLTDTAPNGGAYLVPYAPLVVNRVNDNKMEITDGRGVLHRFGTSFSNETSIEATTSYSGGIPSFGTSALMLMDMIPPNSNDTIIFKYQTVGTASTHDVQYRFVVNDQCNNIGTTCPTGYSNASKVDIISDVNQQGIKEIRFKTGVVKFVMGAPRNDASLLKSLDRIEIYSLLNGTETLVKSIKFFYSYFKDANNLDLALKLDALNVSGNDQVSVQKYKFSYFTNTFSWNRNHVNFWNARDLWGYYNNAIQNTDLLVPNSISYQPTIVSTVTSLPFGGALDRTPKLPFTKEGVLSRIDFPTGGYTEFDFELNQYLEGSTPTPAGGLRVSKIKSSDGSTASPIVKTYTYGASGSGNGLANFKSYQYNYNTTSHYHQMACDAGISLLDYRTRIFYSNSAFNLDGFDNAPVRYLYVTEYNGDVTTGATQGRTEYVYDEGLDIYDNDLTIPQTNRYYRNSMFWKRGKVTKKTVFDNTNHRLSETTTQYGVFNQTVNKLVGLGVYEYRVGPLPCPIESGLCLLEGGEYVFPDTYYSRLFYQSSGAFLPVSVTETSFQADNDTKVVSTNTSTFYTPDKLQIAQTSTTHSNGYERLVTINTYPFQLLAPSSSTGAAKGVYMLNSKKIISVPIESYSYVENPDNSKRIISGAVTKFKQSPSNSLYVVADEVYAWEAQGIVSGYSPSTINGTNSGVTIDSNQKLRATLNFDSKGNILSAAKQNDVVTSYIWGYNKSLPIAEITNSLPKNVFYTSFEEETANFYWDGKTGRKSSKNTAAFTKSLTGLDQGNYILAYYTKIGMNWVYTETPVTVPVNGTYSINLPANQYDEIRFFPKSAQIKTYSYDLLTGVTSMTDANGVTTYYDYDSFGRLKLIRDDNTHVLKALNYHYKTVN